MNFNDFRGSEDPFSESNLIKNRFQNRGEAPRRPEDAQDGSKTPQDGSKTPPRRPQSGPKTAPRRPQDAPRRPQDAPRRRTKSDKKQSKSQPPPDLDFFRFWGRFWRVLGWILGGIELDYPRILRKICRAFGRFAIQDRQRKPSKTPAKPQ